MRGSLVTSGRAALLPHWQVFVLMPGISARPLWKVVNPFNSQPPSHVL